MRTAIRTAASVSSSVGSARSRMASVTGLRRKIELPRSPWSRRPYQRTSWTWSGWSRPSCWAILLTSSAEASGRAMMEAGSPGARWISTKPTVATTSATGISARSRRRTYVFTPAPGLPVEPDVPEHQGGRGDEALDLPSYGLQRGIVAELDTARVLVEELLHALPERPALPGIHLPVERVHQPVLRRRRRRGRDEGQHPDRDEPHGRSPVALSARARATRSRSSAPAWTGSPATPCARPRAKSSPRT